ncbi:hypothetical protein HPB49_016256 [Dermacentor silvarum]|uniref:Uncharacterized protein n=1 Tax=Dermacentor silvarum TaxID=543639 RepID=A0ACB8CYF5_DERSI|nr:hypothetical protein HPB49_016256 [Dermacentor silvarum]
MSGPMLEQQTKPLGALLGPDYFNSLYGWNQRFKDRHGISCKVLCEESGDVDDKCIEVKATTTSKCFNKAGFVRNADALEADEKSDNVADDMVNTNDVWSSLRENKFMSATDTFQEYVDAGESELLVCEEASTDDAIVAAVCSSAELATEDESDGDDDVDPTPDPVAPSIARNVGLSLDVLRNEDVTVPVEHPKERKLAKALLRFPEVLATMLEELYLHPLCDYLFDLSQTFSEFYDNCYCIEKDRKTGKCQSTVLWIFLLILAISDCLAGLTEKMKKCCKVVNINKGRLLLCEATAAIMTKGFFILGIRTVEKM